MSDAVVVLPPETGEAWSRLLPEEGWNCCYLRKDLRSASAGIVACVGEHWRAFQLVFRKMGAVWLSQADRGAG